MDSIPKTLKPLVRRLEQTCPDLSRQDLLSIIFVIRLADILQQSYCASFLTLSLTSKLCNHLGIPELLLELELFVLRWSFRQGTVAVSHRITFDYDMHSCYEMTRIARSVLNDSITVEQGLQRIQEHTRKVHYNCIEKFYDSFPTRGCIIPLMAATCATVFFEGTWLTFAFAAVCGVVAAIIACICIAYNQEAVMDYLVAIAVAMIAASASVVIFSQDCCFLSQVLGTLYWFLYGTAFVLSLYEISNNQLVTGLTRFGLAAIRTYGLAFGTMIGVWLSFYASDNRVELLVPCSGKQSQISDLWFILLFPLAGIACLLQFRVSLNHFPICLIVQVIAYGSQYVLGTVWKQPDFLSNVIPAYLATLSSWACTILMRQFRERRQDNATLKQVCETPEKAYAHSNSTTPTEPYSPQMDEFELQVDCMEEGDAFVATNDISPPPRNHQSPRSSTDLDQLPEMSTQGGEPRRRRQTKTHSNEPQNLDTIGFLDASFANNNNDDDDDEVTFCRSDTWFCLLPALYLLVPGAKIFQTAFADLLQGVFNNNDNTVDDIDEFGGLGFSLLSIGLSQVVGLRFGFLTLSLLNAASNRMKRWRCCTST